MYKHLFFANFKNDKKASAPGKDGVADGATEDTITLGKC
jgi:hypothetical protein